MDRRTFVALSSLLWSQPLSAQPEAPFFSRNPWRSAKAQSLTQALYRPKGGVLGPVTPEALMRLWATRTLQIRGQTWQEAVFHGRGLGFLFGTDLTNEEGYQWAKLARLIGGAHLESVYEAAHRAHANGLESTLGYPAAPNHWSEVSQSKTLVIFGQDLQQPYPLYSQLPTKNNVWTVSSETAPANTQALKIKPGTELALIAGWIQYLFNQSLWDEAFVTSCTNGSYELASGLGLHQGVFSGLDPEQRFYSPRNWRYVMDGDQPQRSTTPLQAETVLQAIANTYTSYTIPQVSAITGIPEKSLQQFYQRVSDPLARPLAVAYSLGNPQRSALVEQWVRALALVQLLTGQIGQPGMGLIRLAPGWNPQGLVDVGASGVQWPGYGGRVCRVDQDYVAWVQANGVQSLRRVQNLLKVWYGPQVEATPDLGFSWLPKAPLETLRQAVQQGQVKLLVALASDPLALGWDLSRLESLVILTQDGQTPALKNFQGELMVLPLAGARQGTLTDLGRRILWQEVLIPGTGDPLAWADQFWQELSPAWGRVPHSDHLKLVPWTGAAQVLNEIAGGPNPVVAVYKGLLTPKNQSQNQDKSDPAGLGLFAGYGWSWPNNIRVLYNRASADLAGQPRQSNRPFMGWDETRSRWQGADVPDLPLGASPSTIEGSQAFRQTPEGVARLVTVEYVAGLNLDTGIAFLRLPQPYLGPLPLFYWPWGSKLTHPLYPNQPTPPLKPH